MNDIATLIGRLLPFAVIASLALIFYLLDVFSVRPGFDSEPATVAARESAAARAINPPQARRSASFPPPAPSPAPSSRGENLPPPPQAAQSQAPIDPANNFAAESEMPPVGEAPEPLPPPSASMGELNEMDSAVPRYVPPAGSSEQPPETDMNTMAPIELTNDEIMQEEADSIDSESSQALDEAEQAASQSGAVDQEQ